MNLQEQKEANLNSLRDRIRQKALQRLQQKETPSLMQNGVDTSEIRDVNEIWGDCRNINGTLKVDGDKIYAEKKSSDIEVLNDTALSDVDTTADKRMRVGDFVDSEANKKAAPLNMSASGEANALSSIRNDADPLNGYANVNSSLLENNIVLPLGDSSQQVASTGIDYTDLISQFKNLSNPIILAFLNNDTSSIFHPTNLIPDKKDTSKNGLATNLKNALITNMWKPRSRAGAENTGDIISTPTNSIKAAPTPTYTKTSPPTPTNTIGASSVSTHTNKAPINTIGAYSTPASVPSKPNFASTNTVTPTISDQVQPAQTTKAIYSKNTTKAPPNKWVNFQAASSSTWINPQTASNSRPTIQGSITSGVSSQPTSLNNSVKPSNITDMAVPPSTSSLLYQESQSTLKAASQTISTRGYNAAMQPQTTFINNTMPTAAIPHNNINFKISTPAISSEYVSRVSKGGMTLISKNIYERDEAKFKALKANIQAEKAKLSQMKKEQQKKTNEVKKVQALQLRIGKNQTRYDYCDRIQIGSDKHSVVSQGAKLLLLTSTPGEKEKNLLWGGRNYIRANSGNYKTKKKSKQAECRYFSREGFCEKGSTCKFAHTKTRIRICQQYLLGRCLDPECLLSHESNDSNAPMCLYYLKGSCSNPECRFIHRRPEHYGDSDYEIWVCRRFAIGGYCDRGEMCPLMHIFECPDFQEDGKCPRGRSCTLSHTITQRTQELMATPSNKYVREDDDVYVEEDKKKIIISSYTIDPEILLTVVPRGKYDIYLDNGPKKKKQKKGKKQEKDNQYIITLSDSDSEYNSDDNDIKNNLDYIQV